MLITITTNEISGAEFMETFADYEEMHRETFSPEYLISRVINTERLPGKTYADKKALLRDQAIDYSLQNNFVIYGSDLVEIGAYFEKYGKRYGLIKEFRENGII